MEKKILVYDLHASESGALAILMDFYNEILQRNIRNVHWSFIVSTPLLMQASNISVDNYPWVKKSWIHRLWFEYFYEKKLIKSIHPEVLCSLQNLGVNKFQGKQVVYLHLPFILTDYRFSVKRDGFKLWLYQHVLRRRIFKSLQNVQKVVVQTQWMKDALIKQACMSEDRILVVYPKIDNRYIEKYIDREESRRTFFFPATAFAYKNHITILKACVDLKKRGFMNFKVLLTIKKEENRYTKLLLSYVKKYKLEPNVEFCGMLPREKIFELYSKSVLVFPSLVESFGMPLLEARLSRCFILAAKTPFASEILYKDSNAYFFDKLDYKQLAMLMFRTMNGELKYSDDSDKIMEQITNNYSIVDIINTL